MLVSPVIVLRCVSGQESADSRDRLDLAFVVEISTPCVDWQKLHENRLAPGSVQACVVRSETAGVVVVCVVI